MSTSIEAQGVTVDEAIQVALNQLGVSRDSVEIKIVHHPRSGFLGIGARKAKVNATLRKPVLQDGEEFDMSVGEGERRGRRGRRGSRRGRGGRGRSGEGSGGDQRPSASPDVEASRPGRSGMSRPSSQASEPGQPARARGGSAQQGRKGAERRERGRRGRRGGRGREREGSDRRDQRAAEQPVQASETAADAPAAGGARAASGQPDRRGGGRDDGEDKRQARGGRREDRRRRDRRDGGEARSARAEPVAGQAQRGPDDGEEEAATSPRRATRPGAQAKLGREEVLELAVPLVSELMRRMGYQAEVVGEIDRTDGEATVSVRADVEGLLIGRRGQTLDALEHIVNRMVFTGEPTSDSRVQLDVGGYRARRREALLELADRLKVRAITQGRRVQVSPMSQRDRGILQGALAGDETIETRVLGSGFYRRVLIAPAGLVDDGSPVEEMADDGERQNRPGGDESADTP